MNREETSALRQRAERYRDVLESLGNEGLLGPASQGHRYFGFTRGELDGQEGVWYREWAPLARVLSLVGDHNGWDRRRHPLNCSEGGIWSIFLTEDELPHGTRVKVHVVGADESALDRIPAYAQRVVQESDGGFTALVWLPSPFAWKYPPPRQEEGLRIYEAHVGMAIEDGRVGTFTEFRQHVLPRIASLGYNAVQLMAIQEHPYYGSFGYHVSSPFAVSSRFGTPEELRELIDAAHGLGLRVFLDLVHSHAVRNLNEGLDRFDGTDHQYFRGIHPAWDSLTYDYGRHEVRNFLLSNVRFWLEEFRFDGLRFDGVTSMLYHDHGLGHDSRQHDDYFGPGVNGDALQYLQLANDLAHVLDPAKTTIAEDVSGMPGAAKPTADGGLGFDYRLAMGVPDLWIRLLKERRDEDWDLHELWYTLLNRRHDERHVGYAESHDQSLVGDQTIAFRLMGASMYEDMERGRFPPKIDRGLALHKIIRLLTFALAGNAWLSFMGNEFGHPEWVDFPREGNGWSYHHARRQWSLADSPFLHYQSLEAFDGALMDLDKEFGLLTDPFIEQLNIDVEARTIAFRRGRLVFAVNLNSNESFEGFRLPVPDFNDYQTVLSTDEEAFSGHSRVLRGTHFPIQDVPAFGRNQSIQIYLPSRTALILSPRLS
ncbi:1,4-alpha-glucan-branching enzyme [bacterium]|nr:MAG: 1,4-alpha-glucan-branching enzyme [bacterium]